MQTLFTCALVIDLLFKFSYSWVAPFATWTRGEYYSALEYFMGYYLAFLIAWDNLNKKVSAAIGVFGLLCFFDYVFNFSYSWVAPFATWTRGEYYGTWVLIPMAFVCGCIFLRWLRKENVS